MCGIFAAFGLTGDPRKNRQLVARLTRRLLHRGPDWTNVWGDAADPDRQTFLAHLRLALVGRGESGDQPLHTADGVHWVVNGEIYNFEQLCQDHGLERRTTTDSEVVGLLYQKYGPDFIHLLDGMYVFALYDANTGLYMAGRDHMGIAPLYMGRGTDGSVFLSSEMKGLTQCDRVEHYEIFPPGHQLVMRPGEEPELTRWYDPAWLDPDRTASEPYDPAKLRETVTKAVVKRLMVDVPHGVLLSGGLDSSLVASIAVKHAQEAQNRNVGKDERLKSFCIGIEGAPDLAAARKVADLIGTEHHEFHFTPEEALDAVEEVVYHIESYHQIRASVPMFLLARKIKAMDVRMVLSGEGADETLGGYLYFHKAPDAAEYHRECVRKTTRLHQWDVLRANKSTMAWSVEARVPFLDKEVLELVMNMDPAEKMCDMGSKPDGVHPKMEKYVLRKAFDTPEDPYLPEEVLWRQKEQFSDGVGYDWVDGLKEYAELEVSDADFAARHERFPVDTPLTKEYYMLRRMFEERFPERCALETIPDGKSIACSTPEAVAWYPEWEASAGDISGRAVDVHDASDGFELEDDAEAGSSGGAVPSFNAKEAPGSTSPVARCARYRSRPPIRPPVRALGAVRSAARRAGFRAHGQRRI